MRSGKAGQEIAEGVLFHEIDDGDLAAERVGICFPEIVGAERDVEEVSRGNAVRSAGLLPRANKLRKNSGKCIAQTGADYVLCFVGGGRCEFRFDTADLERDSIVGRITANVFVGNA
jgi:hypothetical protein